VNPWNVLKCQKIPTHGQDKFFLHFTPGRSLERANQQVLASLTSNDICCCSKNPNLFKIDMKWTCSKLLQTSFTFNRKSMQKQTWNNLSEIGSSGLHAYLKKWLHKTSLLRTVSDPELARHSCSSISWREKLVKHWLGM
jgi:hypothetical protein